MAQRTTVASLTSSRSAMALMAARCSGVTLTRRLSVLLMGRMIQKWDTSVKGWVPRSLKRSLFAAKSQPYIPTAYGGVGGAVGLCPIGLYVEKLKVFM